MEMLRKIGKTVVAVLALASVASAGQVWQSTFDAGPDGVVDVVDGNVDKALIGPAAAGRLQINTMDRSGAFNDNDRGGRALGATLDGNASFSGRYRFNFATLNPDVTQMWESVGFVGNAANITRQKIGIMMRHWAPGGNAFVSLDMIYGEAGTGAFLFDATGANTYGPFGATAIFLGPLASAQTRDLTLAIGYDGTSHELRVELYDAADTLMSGNFVDLDTALSPTGANTVQTMLDALQVSHLGWADYTANGGDRTTEWQVDTLTYFDSYGWSNGAADGTGAFIPEPATALLLVGGLMLTLRRRRQS